MSLQSSRYFLCFIFSLEPQEVIAISLLADNRVFVHLSIGSEGLPCSIVATLHTVIAPLLFCLQFGLRISEDVRTVESYSCS